MLKVAILGVGSRGANTYGDYLNTLKDKVEISAICDIDTTKLEHYQKAYHVSKEKCFTNWDDFFQAGKLADLLIIATLDQQHFEPAMKALDLNYHLLLEKPISPSISVLRYTIFYRKIKEIIDSKMIGNIIHINSVENVGYWHQAHSFVRGNWQNSNETAPMILAKCCHDTDLLNWLIDKNPLSLSSYGHLTYFKKENAPSGSALRCIDCQVRDKCPYDAIRYYVEGSKNKENLGWPYDVVTLNPTTKSLFEAIKTGPYGKCVFHCNNKETIIDVTKLTQDLSGHMGGDHIMLNEFISLLEGKNAQIDSSIEKSVLSHLICMAAEESRLNNGKTIQIAEFKKQHQK